MWPLGVYLALVLLLVAGMLWTAASPTFDRRALRGWHPVGGLGARAPLGEVLPGSDVLRHL